MEESKGDKIMEKNNSLMAGKGEKGKWITVNGSHIFIEDGQSVEDAMNKQFSKVSATPSKHQAKADYLKDKINNSWYKNAKIDYGIEGKVKDISIDGDTIKVVVEENGKTLTSELPYAGEYTAEQLYNIWQEFPGEESVAPEQAKSFVKGGGHLSENGGYQGVSNVKDAPKFEFKSEGSDWENGKYTGDQARFNKFHNALTKGHVGEPAVKQYLSELGINDAGIKNYLMTNELFNTENNPDTSIKIIQRIFNDGDYRK